MIKNKNYFQKKNKHYFHVLTQSYLPTALSFSVGFFLLNTVLVGNSESKDIYELYIMNKIHVHIAAIAAFVFSSAGFLCIINESGLGYHNVSVKKGLLMGFFFFLITELMLFFSFFGAYFYLCLNPNLFVGNVGPPKKTNYLNVGKLPFFNTILLLASGYAATLSHGIMLNQKSNNCMKTKKKFEAGLLTAIVLGNFFLYCQVLEYKYTITTSGSHNAFGSCFFLLTGFHGIHVFMGMLFLLVNNIRSIGVNMFFNKSVSTNNKNTGLNYFFTKWFSENQNFYEFDLCVLSEKHCDGNGNDNLSFEMALFYGHFVDVVGIFLFCFVYLGGF